MRMYVGLGPQFILYVKLKYSFVTIFLVFGGVTSRFWGSCVCVYEGGGK